MQHLSSLKDIALNNAWLAIGTFDGVHRGHQEIVKKLVEGAHRDRVPAIVLTFFPHPAVVLKKRSKSFYLTLPEERAEILGEYGVDKVVTYPFNYKTSQLSAKEFITNIKKNINFSTLVVGSDFALGKNREGDVSYLKTLGREYTFYVLSIPPYRLSNEIVSSSRIRSLILSGQVHLVEPLLGRYYSITGKVIAGDGRGKKINVPTANLNIWHELTLPATGVYTSRVYYQNHWRGAVTNIGVRPTFISEPGNRVVETHILDFEDGIYDQQLKVEFINRIRDEMRFASVDELVSQIQADIRITRDKLIQT